MQPPVLELYTVWHPSDAAQAEPRAQAIIDHYHGDQFSGLISGAIEVFVRSAGWQGAGSPPRPIPRPGGTGGEAAKHVVIIVFLGLGLAQATRTGGPWLDWLKEQAQNATLWGVSLHPHALESDGLKPLFAAQQLLGATDKVNPADDTLFQRDLSQSLTQLIKGDGKRIQIFVSHTKHWDGAHEHATQELINGVRSLVRETRLAEFFDSHSLQAGEDWATRLEDQAASSALLCVRTDHYATREWCHREITAAKTHGMPLVALDALIDSDRRGSFLLDHMPRVAIGRRGAKNWNRADIQRALLILVDECLKRALWQSQQPATAPAGVWWSPHAPEPMTFAPWLAKQHLAKDSTVRILHPDPPLTPCEQSAITTIAQLAGYRGGVDILTPRTLAARGAAISPDIAPPLPANALAGVRLGLSASDSPDLARLGLDQRHFKLALGELARLVLVGGGTLAWGGHPNEDGLTPLLLDVLDEVARYGRKDQESLWLCLSWSVHRCLPLSKLLETQDRLGLYGKLICLNPDGIEIPLDQDRSEAPLPTLPSAESAHALTSLRRFLITHTQGRLMIGGKRSGFQGRQPGLVEEALMTLRAGQPLYLAAGFGGITADIARAAGLLIDGPPSLSPPDPELEASLQEIGRAVAAAGGVITGLEPADMSALTNSHRPSTLASLICQGLGCHSSGMSIGR